MRHRGIYLQAVGSYRPPATSCSEAIHGGHYSAEETALSGMVSVLVADDMPAPEMAARAAQEAIAAAGARPESYDALLHCATHHQGPEGWSPAHYILNQTLAQPITAMEIRQGCLGMLAAFRIAADRLTAGEAHRRVLVTAADNFGTPHVDRWRASSLFLLADAACAAVVSNDAGFAELVATASLSNPGMEELHRGGEPLFPPGATIGRGLNFEERNQYWREQWARGNPPPSGDLGGLVHDTVAAVLADADLTLSDIARVCHVGYAAPALHALFTDPLALPAERSVWELTRTVGHAGAADPLLSLETLRADGQLQPGDHVLLAGAGPGMEVACAVLTLTDPH